MVMKRTLILSLLTLLSFSNYGQEHVNVREAIDNLSLWTSNVIPLASDSNCSSFIIRVEEKVKPHYHEYHTETLYVVKGRAKMQLDDKTIIIKRVTTLTFLPKQSIRLLLPL